MSNSADIRTIATTLTALQAELRQHEQERNEIRARLLDTEQKLAAPDGEPMAFGTGAPALGSRAIQSLGEDPVFQSAALAAERRVKGSQFAARATLDCSIRAALTNTPSEGTSSEGYYVASQPERRGIVGEVLRPLRLLEVLPSRPVSTDSVEFVRLESSGNPSEQVDEGDTKAELDFAGELVRADIVTIAGWTSASKQVLSDHAALQQLIDQVMRHRALARLEHQLINGGGGQGHIEGLLALAPELFATIGDSPADVIGEALVGLANQGYAPGLVLLNPLDWFRLQITKTDTEGEYLFGSPTAPVPPSLWSTPIVTTPSMPQGTGLAADTSFTTVLDRQQVTVTISDSHEDYFARNLIAILAELRAGLEVTDEGALRKFNLAFPSE